MKSALPLLPTTLVGWYAQPDWLIDREKLGKRFPPRVRASELWRVAPELLEQAQDDATIIAIRDQERAGLDIITDGEMRRESYSNRFATALEGVDIDNPGTALDRSGIPIRCRVWWAHPAPPPGAGARRQVPAWPIPTAHQDHRAGPLHHEPAGPGRLLQGRGGVGPRLCGRRQCRDRGPVRRGRRHRAGRRALHAGAPEKAKRFGVKVLDRALDGVGGITAMHICFGYAAVIHNRPSGYSFLPELEGSTVRQISIETAQAKLDCSCWRNCPARLSCSACSISLI